jgi:hypothetical protein
VTLCGKLGEIHCSKFHSISLTAMNESTIFLFNTFYSMQDKYCFMQLIYVPWIAFHKLTHLIQGISASHLMHPFYASQPMHLTRCTSLIYFVIIWWKYWMYYLSILDNSDWLWNSLLTDRQTNRPSDIVRHRAAIAAISFNAYTSLLMKFMGKTVPTLSRVC